MNNQDLLIDRLFFLLILMMAAFSTVLMPYKIFLVLIIVTIIVVRGLKSGLPYKEYKDVFIWMVIYIGANILSILVALYLGNPNAFISINTSIIEPVLFFMIFSYFREGDYIYIYRKLKIVLLIVCLYDVAYFLYINGVIPIGIDNLFWGLYPNYGGLSIGFVKIHTNNIPWLIFLVPFEASEIFLSSRKISFLDYFLLILSSLVAIMTLRSTYIMAIGLIPFIILIYAHISNINYSKRRAIIISSVGGVIIAITFMFSSDFGFLIKGAIDKVMLSLSMSQNDIDSGGYVRFTQIVDLLDTWKERPLLGWGASANSKHIVRSDVPGSYEMQYFAMLMQRGIIGFGIFVAQIIWLIKKCINTIKLHDDFSKPVFSILVGFTSILIANFSNPYLGSFDRLILFFTPLMAYKASLCHKENINNVRNKSY